MILEFPEFLPDLPPLNNPGMTVAENVIPAGASYKAFPSFEPYSTALTNYCRGAASARDPETAVTYNFAGDETKLYLLSNGTPPTWDDVSKVGGYGLSADEVWSFTQFGDEMIAVNIDTAMQKYQLGVDTLFSDLDAGAPLARYVAAVTDDFLVVGNTYDAVDGFKPYRVRWPGIGGTTGWTVSATTQADYQDLNGKYGWIQQILSGQYGVIFQERAIVRMDYVGSPAIFQFTEVEINQGTKYPGSCIRVGDLSFFIGLDGFRVFDGNQSVQIGVNKVDNFFFDDLDTSYEYLISSAVDFDNHLVMWAYPSRAIGAGAVNSRILFYNYSPNATKRWSYANISTQYIFSALSQGYTLDGLDSWLQNNPQSFSSSSTPIISLDLLPYPLDSRVWVGNQLQFGIFNADNKLSYASTSVFLDAILETAEAQITPGQRTELQLTKPIVDGENTTVTVQIGTRNLMNETPSFGTAISLDVNGNCQSRSNARYHRLRINATGGFDNAIGVEVLEFKPAGYR